MFRLHTSALKELPNLIRVPLGQTATPLPLTRRFLRSRTFTSLSLNRPHSKSPEDGLVNKFFSSNSHHSEQSPLLTQLRFLNSSSRQRARYNQSSRTGGSGAGSGFSFSNVRRRLNRIPPDTLVYGLIGVNVGIFLLWQYAQTSYQRFKDPTLYYWLSRNFVVSEANFRAGRIWTLLTCCFSHSRGDHILMNCLGLYFIAPAVVGVLGTSSFLALYLGGGIVSSTVSLAWNRMFNNRAGRARGSEGASGAIYATLAYFATTFPNTKFLMFFVVPMPAWAAVGGIFAWDLYSSIFSRGSGTDHYGHIGGMLAGVGYALATRGRGGGAMRWR